jgi:hypothetical protein
MLPRPGNHHQHCFSDFACLLAKRVVRTEANPTFNSAKSGPEWESWKPAVDAEMKLLSPEDLHCYEPVLRHEIPHGHQILQGKMDLKTKRTGKRKA